MGDKSKIEWTDATWNPIAGCSVVSPACTNCYAMAQAARIERMSPASHYAGLTKVVNGKTVWTGEVHQAPEARLLDPLRWKKPRRIFVNSMSDLFHENVPDEWIDKIFAVMALAPQHTFQILTKRPARMRAYCGDSAAPARAAALIIQMSLDSIISGGEALGPLANRPDEDAPEVVRWPLPNVWLGVTAEDQARADERIQLLLATPAAVRFVSVEPMLGPVDLRAIRPDMTMKYDALDGRGEHLLGMKRGGGPRLDWVICGGESGPGARPMHPDWARGLRDQCMAAGVAFHFKQWGEWAPSYEPGKGMRGEPIRVGKSRAGRLLDGVEHNAFPEARP